jgi:hypothetical protein
MKVMLLYFYLILSLGTMTSCEKENSDVAPTDENITLSGPCQFYGKIAGTAFQYKDGQSGYASGANAIKTVVAAPDSSSAIYQSYLYSTSSGDVRFEVNIGTLKYMGLTPGFSVFSGFFGTGMVSYSNSGLHGVEVIWRDDNGNAWSTSNGVQGGSVFEISELQIESPSVKVKALISCKLYNSSGDSKTLDNGIFVGYFTNQ